MYLFDIFYPRVVYHWHECSDPTNSRAVPDGWTCPTCGRTEHFMVRRYDDYDAPTLVNKDTYPELSGQWEPKSVGGRS